MSSRQETDVCWSDMARRIRVSFVGSRASARDGGTRWCFAASRVRQPRGGRNWIARVGPSDPAVLRVPPAGFEPALLPPEGSALSPELRGLWALRGYQLCA